jgi:hypothetical protein
MLNQLEDSLELLGDDAGRRTESFEQQTMKDDRLAYDFGSRHDDCDGGGLCARKRQRLWVSVSHASRQLDGEVERRWLLPRRDRDGRDSYSTTIATRSLWPSCEGATFPGCAGAESSESDPHAATKAACGFVVTLDRAEQDDWIDSTNRRERLGNCEHHRSIIGVAPGRWSARAAFDERRNGSLHCPLQGRAKCVADDGADDAASDSILL